MIDASEKRWIEDFRAVATRKPKSLILYVIDGDKVYVCKKGVSSRDMTEGISLDINGCCTLTDMHDDMDNGKGVL